MSQTGCSAEGLEAFVLRVIGDSMLPEFEDGHIIVVDPGFPVLNGVYIVVEHQNEVLFGQYFKGGARETIKYLNPEWNPIDVSDGFKVKGVVTQRNGRRRKDIKRYDYS